MAELDTAINPQIIEIRESDSPNDRANDTLSKYAFVQWFDSTEQMYITKIMSQLEALEEKMVSEKGISAREQELYARLLDRIWQITGADKKPQKLYFSSPVDPKSLDPRLLFQN